MSNCKFCNVPITWVKMDGKNIPLNIDGVTAHKCKDGVQMPGIPVSGVIEQKQSGIQTGTRAQYAPKGDDTDRQNLILWQSCMKIAVESIKMSGNFSEMDDSMAKRILFVTDMLYEGSMTKWRTGKLVEIPKEIQATINQIQ